MNRKERRAANKRGDNIAIEANCAPAVGSASISTVDLAAEATNRLFFAGEATSPIFSPAHDAHNSGVVRKVV